MTGTKRPRVGCGDGPHLIQALHQGRLRFGSLIPEPPRLRSERRPFHLEPLRQRVTAAARCVRVRRHRRASAGLRRCDGRDDGPADLHHSRRPCLERRLQLGIRFQRRDRREELKQRRIAAGSGLGGRFTGRGTLQGGEEEGKLLLELGPLALVHAQRIIPGVEKHLRGAFSSLGVPELTFGGADAGDQSGILPQEELHTHLLVGGEVVEGGSRGPRR